MGLFDKKFCDICGGKIGLLGNRKLEDGNLCKDCAAKLSPFMTDRRRTTKADIKEHLAYREANKADVAAFNLTRTLGTSTKVLLDEDARKFIVTSSGRWKNENPDVLSFSQVTGCNIEVGESKRELYTKDAEGKSVSFNPPKYEFDYGFEMTINVNSKWFGDIRFRVNRSSITGRYSEEYKECERLANEIKTTLTTIRQETRDNIAAASAPKAAKTCKNCGATTTPDASGRCEFCGGVL
jgi:hypothetical protein